MSYVCRSFRVAQTTSSIFKVFPRTISRVPPSLLAKAFLENTKTKLSTVKIPSFNKNYSMLLNKTTTDSDDKVTSSAVLTDEPKKKNLKYYLKVAGPPAVVFYFGVYGLSLGAFYAMLNFGILNTASMTAMITKLSSTLASTIASHPQHQFCRCLVPYQGDISFVHFCVFVVRSFIFVTAPIRYGAVIWYANSIIKKKKAALKASSSTSVSEPVSKTAPPSTATTQVSKRTFSTSASDSSIEDVPNTFTRKVKYTPGSKPRRRVICQCGCEREQPSTPTTNVFSFDNIKNDQSSDQCCSHHHGNCPGHHHDDCPGHHHDHSCSSCSCSSPSTDPISDPKNYSNMYSSEFDSICFKRKKCYCKSGETCECKKAGRCLAPEGKVCYCKFTGECLCSKEKH